MKLAIGLIVLLLAPSAARAVPVDCSGTIVTGGTAVQAIPAGSNIQGFRVWNLDSTTALWGSETGGAAAVATPGSFPIAAGAATTFSGAGNSTTPETLHPNTGLSLNGITGQKYTCQYW